MSRDLGVLVLRLAFGFQLVNVSWRNALLPAQNIPEFETYLQSLGFPFPTVGAYLSSYTEFIGGLLLLLGFQTRLATIVLIINFTVAVVLAHLSIWDTYQNTFASINLWAVCFFLLLNGPGRYSLDERGHRRL